MNVLGIETSCDETSVAIISENELKANLVSSQDFHSKYGGVVPELSSRAHLQIIIPLVKDALEKSNLKLNDIHLISATAGPGLIGALLVGITFAKGLAYSLNKPFIPVDHIEGHVYSGFIPAHRMDGNPGTGGLEEKPEFPYLVLVVSGGHTLLLLVKSHTEIRKLGTTVDDAAGEAFDKVAKMLGLPYPGGPKIQELSKKGNKDKIAFPVAQMDNTLNFSFSGLKTAVLRYVRKNYSDIKKISQQDLFDITASFQNAVIKPLIANTEKGLNQYNVNSISLVGGVAANSFLRESFIELGKRYNKKVIIPKLEYCGDNAAMIAYRGLKLFESGHRFGLDYSPYPNLTEESFT